MIINFFGDFSQEGRAKGFSPEDFISSFKGVAHILDSADYNIVNLECAPDIHRGAMIPKVGPHLSCNGTALSALKDCGFNCLALANNHFADFGPDSVKDSISLIDSMEFDHVGAGKDLTDAGNTLMVSIQGKTVAFINCCEHEFTVAATDSAGCNPMDPIKQFETIHTASKAADYVFVYVHGGSEHYNLPTPRMQSTYRFFIDCGADLVVNCHQHLFSGYEYYHDKPIVYGLGNFFFDSPERLNTPWNYGYVLQISILDRLKIDLIPYKQCNGEPVISLLNTAEKEAFESKIDELNKLIQNPAELQKRYDDWVVEKTEGYMYSIFPPVRKGFFARKWARLMRKFFRKEPLSRNGLTETAQKTLYNLVHCESHRDTLLAILAKRIKLETKEKAK